MTYTGAEQSAFQDVWSLFVDWSFIFDTIRKPNKRLTIMTLSITEPAVTSVKNSVFRRKAQVRGKYE